MEVLTQKIADRIRGEGPITFESFMEMALYYPGLGYYASDDIEIGRAGDFYTSQHVHSAFGALIARQLAEMWKILASPPGFHVIEPGAGAGLMCMDIMNYLSGKPIFDAITYVIVETNPSVAHKQRKLLGKFSDKIRWVNSLNELRGVRGCILSNELLDAFPVHLIEMGETLKEIYVTIGDGRLAEAAGPLSTKELGDYLAGFSIELPSGYRTEINLRIRDWLKVAGEVLSTGFILTIDYGYPALDYYSEERNRGTLLCYYKHQALEDPYAHIGKQDITAHVNFSSMKKWGEEFGFRTLGFCPQATFLISLGIDEVIRELYEKSNDYLFEVSKIKRLIFPGTLGETHKVMIQHKGEGEPELRGFAMKNRKNRL